MKSTDTMHNPLLEFYIQQPNGCVYKNLSDLYHAHHDARKKAVNEWAWAIPTEGAIKALVELTPIIEIGAGNGYWASLIAQAGGDIIAYDSMPNTRNHYWKETYKPHFPVKCGGPKKAAKHANRTLFLCWPPYDNTMALDTIEAYTGQNVVYVGESSGGCNATDAFFEHLDAHFDCVRTIHIPQWAGIRDEMWVYKRKGNQDE